MNSSYTANRQWADAFTPQIIALIKDNLRQIARVVIASQDDDRHKATDMVVRIDSGDIAVRIRRPDCRYRDLTLRAYVASGYPTELEKIRTGFGRWYLYAWADSTGQLAEWMLIDLDKVRDTGLLADRQLTYNPGGQTGFVSIGLAELCEHDCIIASSGMLIRRRGGPRAGRKAKDSDDIR